MNKPTISANSTPKISPLLPGAAMVRAIVEGRKTQFRIPVKTRLFGPLQNLADTDKHLFSGRFNDPDSWGFPFADDGAPMSLLAWKEFFCPFGGAGDLIWVRETWSVKRFEPCQEHERDWQELHSPTIRYLADCATMQAQGNRSTGTGIYRGPVEKTLSSINMPRWASRLTLRITDLRPQRLQDISEEDAKAEGIGGKDTVTVSEATTPTYHQAFSIYWDNVHKNRAWSDKVHKPGEQWADNPWVWAVTFEAKQANILELLRDAVGSS